MHTDIQYVFNGLCLRRNQLRLLGYSSRLAICSRGRESERQSHASAFQWHGFLFLFGVLLIRKTDFGVHLRHRGVGKVRIISTPDRNRNVCR